MKNHIIIQDWAGNILFQGHYKKLEVSEILNANRCDCDDNYENCDKCNGSGYSGDFLIYWEDQKDIRNVYEWVTY